MLKTVAELKDPSPNEVIQTSNLNYPIAGFLLGTPLIALALAVGYVHYAGFVWTDLVSFIVMYFACGLAITAGYHRYYAHRTFDCHKIVQFFFLAFGAANFQNSVLNWASDHRYHHQYSDRDGDPYSVNRGFWWAHMGWMFFHYPANRQYKNSSDMKNDHLLMWQERWYLPLALVTGFLVPTLIGALFGRPFAGFVWGGAVRMVVNHQVTFMINSMAHTFGSRKYAEKSTARDSPLLAIFTFGEGYHSFHHAYAGDYRIGHHWYDIDWGKWLILSLQRVGLATKLRTTYKKKSQKVVPTFLAKPTDFQTPVVSQISSISFSPSIEEKFADLAQAAHQQIESVSSL
jgi:stearoyl-CoA desaturase (delta-9 desaturase)